MVDGVVTAPKHPFKKASRPAQKFGDTVCKCGFVELMREALGRDLDEKPEEIRYRTKLEHFFKCCVRRGKERLASDDLVRAVKGVVHGKRDTKLRLLWALSGHSDKLPISQKDLLGLLADIPASKLKTDRRYNEHLEELAAEIFQRAVDDKSGTGLVRGCITLLTFIRVASKVEALKDILTINKQLRNA